MKGDGQASGEGCEERCTVEYIIYIGVCVCAVRVLKDLRRGVGGFGGSAPSAAMSSAVRFLVSASAPSIANSWKSRVLHNFVSAFKKRSLQCVYTIVKLHNYAIISVVLCELY